MCKKTQFKYCPSTIDKCMRKFVRNLDIIIKEPWKVVACCCGHGKYPMTIVVKSDITGEVIEIFNLKSIPRDKRFYKKDKQGYYYIPEVIK